MALLPLLGCHSVAFPAIGTGLANISARVAAAELASVLVSVLLVSSEAYTVEIYLLDREGVESGEAFFKYFEESIASRLGVEASRSGDKFNLRAPPATTTSADPLQAAAVERRHQIFTMLQHLNERRNQIEAAVLDTVRKLDAAALESLSRLKRQLAEIEDLIHDYEARLVQHPAAAPDRPARSVFLSSTAIDLQPERKALQDLIEQLQFRFVGMSGFPATGEAPALFIRRMVDESDIYLGILGMRYGSIDTSTGLSMTELEYRQAIAGRKDVRMFVMGDDAPVSVGMIERDPAAFAKLLEFRNLVLQSHMCSIFKDVSDLRKKAENTLKSARQTSGG